MAIIQVDETDLWFMVLATVRYSLGRSSYAPSLTAELVQRYRAGLLDDQVQQIRQEIETELRAAERQGRHVGHEFDHETWRRLAESLQTCEATEAGLG